ncbi:Na+/H+ antiporter [Legionella genomosp. 1]|uniref:Na+/H+ antiporter n=1 Tax=Legionella genomosp. 1 TaxID=1093625 RepID=UPI001054A0B3|nr:Na+/H+ antiporter [Legionella genomosp. 1]
MESMFTCLVLLFILVISGVVSRLLPSLPSPLVQIALGALASSLSPNFYIGFNPELFMLLFIPPLLFSDSWHFPKREFFSNTRPIIMLSIGLVFFTVAGMGYLLHWLEPSIPLAACFALAAALSPTDAVSLKSMTSKTGMPERLRHILQGEALLNDASGLVSFKFSVTAMLTGFFSFTNATISLLLVGLGGIIIGVLLTYLFIAALGQLSRRNASETTTENLLLLLLPYAAYLAAEHLGCSGIIAAVAAGFTLDQAGFLDKTMAIMRIEGRFVWGMLETTLNGIIFILLGLYLPNSFQIIAYTGTSVSNCFLIIALITCSLIALRALWIYLTLPFEAMIARRKQAEWKIPNLKIVTAIAFGGIRGAIALAAILSLPTWMPDGSPFPMRDLLISVVVGVVLCSLLLSAIVLPLIIPSLRSLIIESPDDEEFQARIAAAQAGIQAIEQELAQLAENLNEEELNLCTQVGKTLTASLSQFVSSSVGGETEKMASLKALDFEESLRLAALEGARKELRQLRKKGRINNSTMIGIIHLLDIRQLSLVDNYRQSQLKKIKS